MERFGMLELACVFVVAVVVVVVVVVVVAVVAMMVGLEFEVLSVVVVVG